jgi:hypothetical protein
MKQRPLAVVLAFLLVSAVGAALSGSGQAFASAFHREAEVAAEACGAGGCGAGGGCGMAAEQATLMGEGDGIATCGMQENTSCAATTTSGDKPADSPECGRTDCGGNCSTCEGIKNMEGVKSPAEVAATTTETLPES